MLIELDEFYRFQEQYKYEGNYTYSNRLSILFKYGAFAFLVIGFGFSIYLLFFAFTRFVLMQILPGLGVLLFCTLIVSFFGYLSYRLYNTLLYEAHFQLREDGFYYRIKNKRTLAADEVFIPYEEMESVTMGRYYHLWKPRKYGNSIYLVGVDFAMKGERKTGKDLIVHFGMKDVDEIRKWVARYQEHQVPLFYTDFALNRLTAEGYDQLEKTPFLYETSKWPFVYKKLDKEMLPLNWDGKHAIYPELKSENKI